MREVLFSLVIKNFCNSEMQAKRMDMDIVTKRLEKVQFRYIPPSSSIQVLASVCP